MSITKLYRRDNQPFAQIPNDLIRDPEVTPNSFRLIAYLMSHQDGYELTYQQIERETGLGRFAINGAIPILERKGWLRVDRPKLPNGQFGAKSWTLLTPTSTTVGYSTMEQPHMVQPTDIRRTLNKEEHLEEQVNPQPSVEAVFDEFWMVYPRRTEKRAAFKAFKEALKRASLEEIMDGARRYANDPNRSKEFTKYPATWLNRDCWGDEPLPERVMSLEERRERELAESRRRAEADKRHTERLMREAEEAARRAVPVPMCEHGVKLTKCRQPHIVPDQD